MTFTRSFDFELIGEIMRHPALYQADDYGPAREHFQPRQDPEIRYVLVEDAGDVLGLFILAPQNTICWEIHTRLLPLSWGKRAAEAARGLIAWLWAETFVVRLVTSVPAPNRLAIRFAERAGLKRFGTNLASYQKDGTLYDQVLLGISR